MIFLFAFDRERFARKWVWAALFAIYMNAMMIVVVVPYAEYITWHPYINLIPFNNLSSSNILGMVLNIIMLIPFGAFLPIYFKKFRKLSSTVIAGALMSLTIEVLQLFVFRATDINDLIMNTLGALVGYFVAKVIIRKSWDDGENDKDILKLVVMIIISILVVVFVINPLMTIILRALGMM